MHLEWWVLGCQGRLAALAHRQVGTLTTAEAEPRPNGAGTTRSGCCARCPCTSRLVGRALAESRSRSRCPDSTAPGPRGERASAPRKAPATPPEARREPERPACGRGGAVDSAAEGSGKVGAHSQQGFCSDTVCLGPGTSLGPGTRVTSAFPTSRRPGQGGGRGCGVKGGETSRSMPFSTLFSNPVNGSPFHNTSLFESISEGRKRSAVGL